MSSRSVIDWLTREKVAFTLVALAFLLESLFKNNWFLLLLLPAGWLFWVYFLKTGLGGFVTLSR